MDTVLVTGGTGHLGRELVTLLKQSCPVRVLARNPGSDPDVEWVTGDLATGEGITPAVRGARVVVHAATLSPVASRGYPLPADFWHSPPEVDVDATQSLLDEASRAGVTHFVYISITGAGTPHIPYMRLKHTGEELVRIGSVPWSIVRSTQFHWLFDRMVGKAMKLPVLALPAALPTQPVDDADFAAYVAECVANGPAGEAADFGGPEILTLGEAVGQWQQVRATNRKIFHVPAPRRLSNAAEDLITHHGRRGTTTWLQWLETHSAE